MNTHQLIESVYVTQTDDFAASGFFRDLESVACTAKDYNNFIVNVCRTHLKSPHILAFLYAVAPPAAAENLKHNLLEELGLDAVGVSHPGLLLELAAAAGFDRAKCDELERAAQDELRRTISEPILFGTLKEIGLSVLLETVAFEWMLSRLAGRMARFLQKNRGLSKTNLEWFHHHSEVDVRHAEEGLRAVADYIEFYEFDSADLATILDVTFRENVFVKRYFGEIASATENQMLS
jgi:hypothetical protein